MQGDYVSRHCGGAVTNPRESRSNRDRFTLFDVYHLGDFDMRWRDIRFEKPTEADANEGGYICQLFVGDQFGNYKWYNLEGAIAWCPTSELPAFDPIPDPPEGWRWATTDDSPNKHAKVWSVTNERWMISGGYIVKGEAYIVPVDPPEPQYRPYNAAELKETIGKLVDGVAGYRAMITGACGDSVYCQGQRVPADQLLKNHAWTDGGKCGVKVEPFEP
jgi:hypothetical protein